MAIIEAQQLSKTYANGVKALRQVDLQVEAGEVFGLLGPNGAGKTTAVRILNGTLQPTGGTYRVLGESNGSTAIRQRTATISEQAALYTQLSVQENLLFFADMYGIERGTALGRIQYYLKRMELWERRDDKFGTLSTGQKKRIQIARTLLHEPELIFLDEPTSGLDPDAAEKVNTLIRTLAEEQHTAIFLCTHNLPLAEKICDSFGFLSKGELVKHGSKAEIVDSIQPEKQVEIDTKSGQFTYPIKAEQEINGHIQSLINSGHIITGVRIPQPSLEDAYFHYIERSQHELV